MKKVKKRVRHDYIDNQKFFKAMEEFYHETQRGRAAGIPENELPIPSDYIAKCIYDIANRMAYSGNFIGYTWREDMVGDGIEDAFLRIRNFNPANAKKNAFGYFSMIIWNAFLRRIAKEKKQQYIKYKAAFNSITNSTLTDIQYHDDKAKATMIGPKDVEIMSTFISEYDETVAMKKNKTAIKKQKLEKLIED